jgi:sialidase-1
MLIYVKHSAKCEGDCGTGNGLVISEDDGLTWSEPEDLSTMFGPASGSLPGPGTALQLTSGEKKGRLLVVSHHSAYVHDFVSYSDDDGKTWQTINQTFAKMDEAAMTQLGNGSVLLNMRHGNSKNVGRAVAVSNDGGSTFGPIHFDAALISPVCQASIVTFAGATYFRCY